MDLDDFRCGLLLLRTRTVERGGIRTDTGLIALLRRLIRSQLASCAVLACRQGPYPVGIVVAHSLRIKAFRLRRKRDVRWWYDHILLGASLEVHHGLMSSFLHGNDFLDHI